MTRPITYDESVIGEFARRLYQRAATIIVLCILGGLLAGGLLGGAAAAAARGDGKGAIVFLFLVLGGVIGFVIGRERAFMLKLQAQVALCQVQIERNTRAIAYGGGRGG